MNSKDMRPPLPARMYSDARGYFAFPLIEEDLDLEDFDKWSVISDHVERVKSGDFDAVGELISLYDRDDDWVRRGAYVQLIGDAGRDELLAAVHRELLPAGPLDYAYDFSEALCYWGRLTVVPDLADLYLANCDTQDGPYLLQRLGLLLENDAGPLTHLRTRVIRTEAASYHALVLQRHANLIAAHGEDAHVFRGQLLDVESIARLGLRELAEGSFRPEMRHKFEAMTGIDCTPFYDNGRLQPLAAAAILEAFLSSPQRHAFVPGRRYFFGHPIPSGDPEGAAQWPPR